MEQNKPNKFVEKFYLALWDILKVLLVIAVIALVIFTKVSIDSAYVNWLTK